MGTFTNSEDSAEVLHNTAFHQGLHCSLTEDKKAFSPIYVLIKSTAKRSCFDQMLMI